MAEPLKATFFALTPRDRAVLLPATLVVIVVLALLIGAFVGLNWGTLSGLFQLLQTAQPGLQENNPEATRLLGATFGMIGAVLLFLFPIYLTVAAYEAACLRWMIRGEAPGLFGMTIDNDTWRVYGVYWCWFLMHMVVSFAMSIVMLPIMFMFMGTIMADPMPDPQKMMEWQLTVQAPLSLLQYAPLIFLGVRFSPAAASSVALRRFAFFAAWKATDGRFWSLFGSFALLWLIMAIAYVAVFAATYVPLVGPYVGEMASNWPAPMSNEDARAMFETLFSPRGLALIGAGYAISIVLYIAYSIFGFGINARAAMVAVEEGNIAPPASA